MAMTDGRGGGGGGGGGGNDAIGRLAQTHRRIEGCMSDLDYAISELSRPDGQADAIDVLEDAVAFFGSQAVRHHEDEELLIFPALAARPELAPLLETLRSEHVELAIRVETLTALAGKARAGLDPAALTALRAAADHMLDLERSHLTREDTELLPAAAAALPEPERQRIAEAMRARRR